MSVSSEIPRSTTAPPLPRSIWVVAWACLAGQVVAVVQRGGRLGDEFSLVVSVVLGALVVGYVAAGVVRARTVRMVLAVIVLVLSLLGEVVALFAVDHPGQLILTLLALATTVVALAGLVSFRSTDWYSWQRTRPAVREGAPIGRLVAIGVVVGLLGGLVAPADNGVHMQVRVNG